MRVLIPLHSFVPYSRFGAELYTYYLAKELLTQGIDVHVLFTDPDAPVGTSTHDGIKCTVIRRSRARGPSSLDSLNPEAESAFVDLLATFEPDVVHLNHLLHLSPNLPKLAKAAGTGVVFTLHDYWLACSKVKFFDRWGDRCEGASAFRCASCARHRYSRMWWPVGTYDTTGSGALTSLAKELVFQVAERPGAMLRIIGRERELRRIVPFVDQFIAPSRFLAARLEAWGIPRERLTYCDYGTMELPYAFPSRQKGLPPLQFGYLGAASPEKGLHVLLEAFRGFHDAELIIFGGTADSLRARYPQFADVLSQRNVRPKGSIGDHEKVQVLPNLDALIVPSIWFENSPVVIHEAFQAGIPVICSNTGGMAELVTHGVDGLHFEVGNAAALRRVLRECAATPDRLLRLAQGIRKPTGMRDHVTREIVPLYEELLGLRHSTDKEYAR